MSNGIYDYEVVVDETSNTKDGELTVDFWIKPAHPLQFITMTIRFAHPRDVHIMRQLLGDDSYLSV